MHTWVDRSYLIGLLQTRLQLPDASVSTACGNVLGRINLKGKRMSKCDRPYQFDRETNVESTRHSTTSCLGHADTLKRIFNCYSIQQRFQFGLETFHSRTVSRWTATRINLMGHSDRQGDAHPVETQTHVDFKGKTRRFDREPHINMIQ